MPGPSLRQKAKQDGPFARTSRSGRNAKSGRGRAGQSTKNAGEKSKLNPDFSTLPEPLLDEAYLKEKYPDLVDANSGVGADWRKNPKSALANFMLHKVGNLPKYEMQSGYIQGKKIIRVTVTATDDIVGLGDSNNRKEAERIAALAALHEIISKGLGKKLPVIGAAAGAQAGIELSDGSNVGYDRARQFMDYYCQKFGFGQPFVDYEEQHGRRSGWEAVMTVGGRRIGIGSAKAKKDAAKNCYLDVVQYLEKCDPQLWKDFVQAAKTGKDLGLAPKVYFQMSDRLEDDIRDVNMKMKRSILFSNRPDIAHIEQPTESSDPTSSNSRRRFRYSRDVLVAKSTELSSRRQAYLSDPRQEKMRGTRQSLPVYTKAEDVLKHVEENDITILMAATGSGKTTQIPQLILDQYIDRNEGGTCNIICTQPRRLAAISVAHRVAKERGETVGKGGSIGYQVRFETAMPDENGSVTFCTIGIFLRRMQSALQRGYDRVLDNVTHVVVDEVHERDIDTDLLLVVLKRLLEDRRAKGNPLKVILMSATIDPTLFQTYFPDEAGNPAKVIEVPGRSFPVQKHFLDDFLPSMVQQYRSSNSVFNDEKVVKYLHRELPNAARLLPDSSKLRALSQRAEGKEHEEELEIPYPLVALTMTHVLRISNSGHVLVFLPGWEEIQAVQRALLENMSPFGLDFNDRSKFSLHVLHSTVPLAEQQVIFDPPPEGVRRVILATNIAETSVTIPDVVYVVDTAKIKENRYDPERHISSLVSAWVGTSNLNQRAGRAGRHRSGEYYGVLSQSRANRLQTHQTVEMKRMDLSNVVMHVKALEFPGMDVEGVLAATIEPPEAGRVAAAMQNLKMGRVLLELPVEVQMGRLVLYGSFFKCLDQALTLAAIFTNRDPFLCPPLMKKEAQAVKDSWCPEEFRSDALAVLNAYNAWHEFERRNDYGAASRFCSDNFLSKSTLLTIAKVKGHLLQSLANTGVLDVSAGGTATALPTARSLRVPPELDENGKSLPLLAALIAIASQPKFAIRTSSMTYRTAQDKTTAMHPSSVNHRKRLVEDEASAGRESSFSLFQKSDKICR
ncbi:P-loop containing nucleoside triphosphate hydrolase protein [Phellopilus nigrolimitatus]|nr:P-loop containing nucleoside triphosphate hydrolase protein [Phellopilus nigrolimitatus]